MGESDQPLRWGPHTAKWSAVRPAPSLSSMGSFENLFRCSYSMRGDIKTEEMDMKFDNDEKIFHFFQPWESRGLHPWRAAGVSPHSPPPSSSSLAGPSLKKNKRFSAEMAKLSSFFGWIKKKTLYFQKGEKIIFENIFLLFIKWRDSIFNFNLTECQKHPHFGKVQSYFLSLSLYLCLYLSLSSSFSFFLSPLFSF